jgi:hypothetical protein
MKIKNKLIELGYEKVSLNETLKDIKSADDDIKKSIAIYFKTGVIEEITEEPFTVSGLIDDYDMNPIAALLYIDWYRKEPEDALRCLMTPDEITEPDEIMDDEEFDVLDEEDGEI